MPAAPGLSTMGYAPRALATMAGFGEREAAVDGHRRFTYGGLHRRVLGMADVLWRHGVRCGQTVGVLALNPAESLFLQFAAHLLGCRSAWVAPSAPPAFRQDFLQLAAVDAFVYDAVRVRELGAEMADASPARTVFRFGPADRDIELAGECLPERLSFARRRRPGRWARCSRPAGRPVPPGWCTGRTTSRRSTGCPSTMDAAGPPAAPPAALGHLARQRPGRRVHDAAVRRYAAPA